MAVTAAEMVSEIDDAIKAIVSGKVASRTLVGKAYTMLNLRELKELRSHYASESVVEAREADGPLVVEMGGTE